MIHFKNAREFVDAIVAPHLERFKYVSVEPDMLPTGTGSKFVNVRHLHLSYPESLYNNPLFRHCNTDVICEAFPNVRHVESRVDDWSHLFHPGPQTHRKMDRAREPHILWTAP